MLKHIIKDKNGTWHFGPYFEYLGSIKSRVPVALRDLICNENRYRLDNRQSFHDAWLISQTLHGPQETNSQDVFSIDLVLFGPWHDRYFELKYLSVETFKIELAAGDGPIDGIEYRGEIRRKDDLMVHEFDVSGNGIIEHRILFVSGMAISIACSDIRFVERLIADI